MLKQKNYFTIKKKQFYNDFFKFGLLRIYNIVSKAKLGFKSFSTFLSYTQALCLPFKLNIISPQNYLNDIFGYAS